MKKNLLFGAIILVCGILIYNQKHPISLKWPRIQFDLRSVKKIQPVADGERISVVLTGFGEADENGKWSGEAAPFMQHLDKVVDKSSEINMCQSAFLGQIYGNPALVVVSGMAKVNTTACLSQIFSIYGLRVKEVIVAGIGGISPTRGGKEPVMLGDVCISSLAVDFDLQHYSADAGGLGVSVPQFWPQQSTFSSQSGKGTPVLADELYSASGKVVWPQTAANVVAVNALYHGDSRAPKAWGPRECMEVSSDLYWHDIKADGRARELAASYMNQVFESDTKPADMVVVTSMEAVPAVVLINKWNKNNYAETSFAYVRGASNFDQVYLDAQGNPAKDGRASIEDLKARGLSEYAIGTAALPVLKMFELRGVKSGI